MVEEGLSPLGGSAGGVVLLDGQFGVPRAALGQPGCWGQRGWVLLSCCVRPRERVDEEEVWESLHRSPLLEEPLLLSGPV